MPRGVRSILSSVALKSLMMKRPFWKLADDASKILLKLNWTVAVSLPAPSDALTNVLLVRPSSCTKSLSSPAPMLMFVVIPPAPPLAPKMSYWFNVSFPLPNFMSVRALLLLSNPVASNRLSIWKHQTP